MTMHLSQQLDNTAFCDKTRIDLMVIHYRIDHQYTIYMFMQN